MRSIDGVIGCRKRQLCNNDMAAVVARQINTLSEAGKSEYDGRVTAIDSPPVFLQYVCFTHLPLNKKPGLIRGLERLNQFL